MTAVTMSSASTSVLMTSLIEALMNVVASNTSAWLMPLGKLSGDLRQTCALTCRTTSSTFAVGEGLMPMKTPEQAAEGDAEVVVLRAEDDGGDVLEPHDRTVRLPIDEALELLQRMQVGRGGQIDADHLALGLCRRRTGSCSRRGAA